MKRLLRFLIPLRFRARLSIDVQAWLFGEFITSVHGSAMLLDNFGLTITIDDKPEPSGDAR